MTSNPWMKFYPTDWQSDPRLRMCGPAARGLWIEMLCVMHDAKPYGHLLVNGEAPTDSQLAVLTGILPSQLPDLLGELGKAGVFSKTAKGVIFSRRLVRDEKRSRIASTNGSAGGNPTLGNKRTKSSWLKQKDKGKDKPQSQRPELPPTGEATAIGCPGGFASLAAVGSYATPPVEEKLTPEERAASIERVALMLVDVTKNLKRIPA